MKITLREISKYRSMIKVDGGKSIDPSILKCRKQSWKWLKFDNHKKKMD